MAFSQAAGLAMDGGDRRLSVAGTGITPYSERMITTLHDSSVTFEEYLHHASLTRAMEKETAETEIKADKSDKKWYQIRKPNNPIASPIGNTGTEKDVGDKEVAVDGGSRTTSTSPHRYGIQDEDWIQASRAGRSATWGAVFYLITTDILGPYSVPWALSQMGYGPGVVLYTIFGALAGYGGYQLWVMFLHLDSDRYPLKTYSDIGFRVYGPIMRHGINILQTLQLFFNVGILILSNGQGISQLSKGNLCFIICSLVFALAGCILGQVRTLQRFGWIANVAIWLNLLELFMIMGVAANSPPNYAAALAQNEAVQGPIIHYAGVPDSVPFSGQVVGLMQAVYSYGGAMLFVEFMSEMKRPWDFWKGMLCAQTFIFVVYLFFGIFVYAYQGQFVIITVNQGLSPFSWQTVTNIIGLISSLIAAALYGNIGIKIIYANILQEFFKFPSLQSKRGKILFGATVPIYWSLAFIVCSAIPNMTNFSGLIAAACILQFSYTFPPMLMMGFMIKKAAILPEETFDPQTGELHRVDGGMKRWARGAKKHIFLNTWNLVFFLGSAATAVLGIYSAVTGLITTFATNPAIVSFSCINPIGA
ncbi:hypothetical protein MMC09_006957 [Bachmanniomyces sp. S44760]|nr:hypothetical protein [Bachmanniomyces sp. S44760]